MKHLNPFIHTRRTPEARLAAVRAIAEGTAPTGRQLLCQPWREFRAAPAPKWVADNSGLASLRALNLKARLAAATIATA